MAEGGSNDGGNYDDAIVDDGKRNVGCEGEADHDGDDNDNGGVDDDCGVDINDGNDTNGGDGMSKTNRDDADVGGGNSYNDGGVDGNGAFDVKGGDVTDDGDEETESIVGDLAKYNGSSKMEMKVETVVSAQKSDI